MRTEIELVSRIRTKEDIGTPRIDVLDPEVLGHNYHLMAARFAEITNDALGNYPDQSGRLEEMVLGDIDLFFVASDRGEPLGVGGYRIQEVPHMGRVLVEDIKMIRKIAQGKRIGRQITQEAIDYSEADFLALFTQNPTEIASVSSLLEKGSVAPIDFAYGSSQEYSRYLNAVCNNFGFWTVNSNTGVSRGSYGQRLGNYQLRDEERILAINTRMRALGLKRERGDSVLVLGKIAK